jgi:hypothetical protein
MAMPRNPHNGRITISTRLPVELVDSLDAVAEARIMGRSKLIELLLIDGLTRLDPVHVRTTRLGCSNCGHRLDDHCDQHQVPCCPGTCDVSPTEGASS